MTHIDTSHGRRKFIKTSALASLGATAALNTGNTIAREEQQRPFVTGRKDKKLVGCYCSTKEANNIYGNSS